MRKIFLLIFLFTTFNTACFAYIDPVSTGILYQVLFFLIAGFLSFFTKLKKILTFLNRDYKYSNITLYLISFFPIWLLLSDLNIKEVLITLAIFFVIPLTILYLLKFIFLKQWNSKSRFYILLNSIVITYGLDQSMGLASIINFLEIFNDIYRYVSYGLFFIFCLGCCYLIYSINTRIINFFIIIIVFSNSINFIKSEKNIKNLKQYEIIENVISDIKIENVVSKIDPTIVIILDELNGYGALNDDIINTKETKESYDTLFKEFNFTHYPNAYSIYKSTADSIPSYLNFHYKYSYEEMSNFSTKNTGSFGFFRKITSNKLFDLFDPNKIYVRQPLLINFCGYENFKTCKTINPFQKKNKYIPNFNLNSYDYIFSQFTFQTSIFATLLTRTLRYFDIIKVIEPRLIGKVSVQSTIDDILKQSKTRKYDLLIAHIMAPHKPFAWSNGNCEYKYYQNPNFISDRKSQEFHNIEIQCMNKYLRDFLSKLSDDNLLDHYNIIFASDHGARNLNISNNFKDWHSTLYAQRLKKGKYKKINDIKPSQLLFANFFNKKKNNVTINKYFDSKSSSYKKIID